MSNDGCCDSKHLEHLNYPHCFILLEAEEEEVAVMVAGRGEEAKSTMVLDLF